MNQIIGYVRVSTEDQNEDRQLDGETVHKKFIEKVSAKSMDRPQLKLCLEYVREGDMLIVHSMDRLARNSMDLHAIVKTVTDKGASVRFIKEGKTYTGNDNPMDKLILGMMASFAEFERNVIRDRQAEGVRIAKAKGVYAGRSKVLTDNQTKEMVMLFRSGVPKTKLAKKYGVSAKTVYNYIKSL